MGLPAWPGPTLPLVLVALLVAVQVWAGTGLVLPMEGRQKRDSLCPPGKYVHSRNSSICCTKCHKGTYLFRDCPGPGMDTDCRVCEPGSFTAFENHHTACLGCSVCRAELNQVELSPCTRDRDTVCGCGKNQFRLGLGGKPFECRGCSLCPNGTVRLPCQDSQDTLCNCHAGFYLKNNLCVPCSSCKEHLECSKSCLLPPSETVTSTQDSGTAVLLPLVIFLGLCLVGSLFLAFLCHHPRWKSKLHSIVCQTAGPVKEVRANWGLPSPKLHFTSYPGGGVGMAGAPRFHCIWAKPVYPSRTEGPGLVLLLSRPSWLSVLQGELEAMKAKSPAFAPSPGPVPASVPAQHFSANPAGPLPSSPVYAPSDWPPASPLPPHPRTETLQLTRATPAWPDAAPCGDKACGPFLDDPASLYAVVDSVPPTRWKELVRRLGVGEHEVELQLLQHGGCLREAHYSMLEAWRRRTPRHAATLHLLGRVLTAMDLQGCLEDIQEALAARGHPP
ncbi:LOW QUALITY PROTEIN: tumor necrosis factor receptor superfamily member 1A [Thomomys bottae]